MSSVCFECGAKADAEHHVIPRSRGGTKTVALCISCHGKVHDVKWTSLRELTIRALDERKKNGLRCGSIPYGYDCFGEKLVPNELEQKVINQILLLRAEGLSYQAIADRLNSDGVRTKNGCRWASATLFYLLRRLEKLMAA